jgi:hypothetical protein
MHVESDEGIMTHLHGQKFQLKSYRPVLEKQSPWIPFRFCAVRFKNKGVQPLMP